MQISSELRKLDLLLWVNISTSSSQFLWQIIHFMKLNHSLGYFEQLGPSFNELPSVWHFPNFLQNLIRYFIVFQKLCTPIIIIITIFNLIFRLFTIMKYYNLFKTSRTTPKNPLTPAIHTNENKKEILNKVDSTIWFTRLIQLNILTVNYGSSRVGNEIPKEV